MRIYRRRRADNTQADIVAGLLHCGYRVDIIGQPVDILVGRESWGNRWLLLEAKTPTGKRNPKARVRSDQPDQNDFCARYRVPRVTSWLEAQAAILDLTRGWDR